MSSGSDACRRSEPRTASCACPHHVLPHPLTHSYARLRKEQDERITDLSLSVISVGSSPGDPRTSVDGAVQADDTTATADVHALHAKLRHMQNTSTRLVDQLSEQRRAMRQMRLGKDRIIAALQNERLKCVPRSRMRAHACECVC